MICPHGTQEEERAASVIEINPAMRKHWELEIKTLQNAPRDSARLRSLLKVKQGEYEREQQTLKIYKD